ncbi:cellulose binding domain-containing protein [Planomonospora sp. ID67723]|uniref:cellulose binding domain-containing protein n=1 Tax=Planomonospora sp. ID67723 TaxID=2738134 RepID=UPI0018C41621|nr:cellulose binding domain-containing protein [Planomonospora sp. ID67723]MBG0832583.1 cellulose binding domain-containing protein [Planomonospora sp. ID67723]
MTRSGDRPYGASGGRPYAPGAKTAAFLGAALLVAATALVAAACAGGNATPRHASAHRLPPASPASPAAGCTATLTLVESWPGGYRGTATISNTTGRPMRDWYIQWLLPHGATITQAWKGTPMQSGPIAMIHAPAGDPVLAPGATASGIGFVGAAATPPAFTEITCG